MSLQWMRCLVFRIIIQYLTVDQLTDLTECNCILRTWTKPRQPVTNHHSAHQISQSNVISLIWFEDLTEENHSVRLSCSKQSRNDVSFISFTVCIHSSHTEKLTEWLTVRPCSNKAERRWNKTPSLHKGWHDNIQSVADGHSQCVEIRTHQYDIHWFQNQGQLNLLLWLASITAVVACHAVTSCL